MTDLRGLYLDLLKKALTCSLYDGKDGTPWEPEGVLRKLLVRAAVPEGVRLLRPGDPATRETGSDWPSLAHTMIGSRRLDSLQLCVETALAERVPGDLIETGAWRGGACILMRGILAAWGVRDRTVWVADSFEGLPPPDAANYPADAGDPHHTFSYLAVPLEEVKANFERYGVLDGQVRFLKGRFKDTLSAAPIERLAVARLDGDMYESTMDGLMNLYPKLSPGGFLIVDDYGAVAACRKAVDDYRERQKIREAIVPIDWTGAYWRRGLVTSPSNPRSPSDP